MISDPLANELAAGYLHNPISINPPPTLTAAVSGTNTIFMWPTWGAGFNLQATADFAHGPWTNTAYTAQTNGNNLTITIPIPANGGYFRLQHP